jgi:hypothetical protein
MFDQLNGPLVLICGQNILEAAPKDKDPVSDRNSSSLTRLCFHSYVDIFWFLLLLWINTEGAGVSQSFSPVSTGNFMLIYWSIYVCFVVLPRYNWLWKHLQFFIILFSFVIVSYLGISYGTACHKVSLAVASTRDLQTCRTIFFLPFYALIPLFPTC